MNFHELFSIPSLWDMLKDERRPILLYGTGNGGDKILDVCKHYGINVSGVFASDGFVRDREFRQIKVISYSRAREIYGDDVVILCAFGSPREEVLSFLSELDVRHELYLPDVPLFCDDLLNELFTSEYLSAHRGELELCDGLWEDEHSRLLYREILAYRLTGRMRYLARTEPFEHSVKTLLPSGIRRVIDGGAFNGDTARIFLSAFDEVEHVICVEPDERSFRKLSAFVENESRCKAVSAALGERTGLTEFLSSASRGSATKGNQKRGKSVSVPVATVDSLLVGEGDLLLKLDVEGAEARALSGSVRTVTEERASLAVALYHRTADIFALPLAIRQMRSDMRLYLRRSRCVPGWELTLFGV